MGCTEITPNVLLLKLLMIYVLVLLVGSLNLFLMLMVLEPTITFKKVLF